VGDVFGPLKAPKLLQPPYPRQTYEVVGKAVDFIYGRFGLWARILALFAFLSVLVRYIFGRK